MKKLFNRTSKSSEQEREGSIPSMSSSHQRASGIIMQGHDLHKRRHQSATVTPFPLDAGRPNGGSRPPSHPNSTPAAAGQMAVQPQLVPQPVSAAMMQKPVPPPPGGAALASSTPPPRPPRDSARGAPAPPGQPDYRQMEEEAASAPFRREGGNDRTSMGNPRSRSGTGGTGSSYAMPTPEPRSSAMPGPGRSPNDPPIAQMYARPDTAMSQTTPTQPPFFLPPGAGPPSPQFRPATRPSTPPTSGRFSHSHQGSIPSLHNVASNLPPHITASSYEGPDGYSSARSRGYSASSQSGRGSDQEGSVHPGSQMPNMLGGKSGQGQSPLNRSPLANNFNSTSASNGDDESLRQRSRRELNASGIRTSMPSIMGGGHHPASAESNRMENLDRRHDGKHDSRHFFSASGTHKDKDDKDKEKKKGFWSGWGDRKHNKLSKHQSNPVQGLPKSEDEAASSLGHGQLDPIDTYSSLGHGHMQYKDVVSSNGTTPTVTTAPIHLDKDLPVVMPGSMEDNRQSAEGYRGDAELSTAGGHASSLGHGGTDVTPKPTSRSRSASNAVSAEVLSSPRESGPDRTRKDGDRNRSRDRTADRSPKTHAGEEDVYSAIRQLCSRRETTQNAVLELCERINNSESPDAVSKDAARGLRKVFKHGTDPERRMATRLWWLTMRNVKTRPYHHFATCRKFMAAVEPIVTNKLDPPPSQATLRWAIDVLAGLTFAYHNERGCEGLQDLWKKIKLPEDLDTGRPLPDDFLLYSPGSLPPGPNDAASINTTTATVRTDRTPKDKKDKLRKKRDKDSSKDKDKAKPRDRLKYQPAPSHEDDIQKLIVEASEGKENARVLSEALVYTAPSEFDDKIILQEYHSRCQQSFTSLSTQMDWAQSEAAKSRRVAGSVDLQESRHMATPEESALDVLLEAHGKLSDAMEQYDELARSAAYEKEVRAVEEISKKDTRMDRRQKDMLMVDENMRAEGSAASRSPSPGQFMDVEARQSHDLRHSTEQMRASYEQMRITQDRSTALSPPPTTVPVAPSAPMSPVYTGQATPASSQGLHTGTAVASGIAAGAAGGAGITVLTNGFAADRSSTPSPEDHPLPQPPLRPMLTGRRSPVAAGLPQPAGRRIMGGPRPLPLPNAFRSHNSTASLHAASEVHASSTEGPNGTANGTPAPESSAEEIDDDGPPKMPSRKALGKRRADPDNDFDPDSLFTGRPKPPADNASEISVSLDDVYAAKPVKYAYDAYAERLALERDEQAKATAAAAPVSAR